MGHAGGCGGRLGNYQVLGLRGLPQHFEQESVGDGKTAAVSYTSNFKAGTLSFYMKISSEVGYDYGSFFIDGVRQNLPGCHLEKRHHRPAAMGVCQLPVRLANTPSSGLIKGRQLRRAARTGLARWRVASRYHSGDRREDPQGLHLISGDARTISRSADRYQVEAENLHHQKQRQGGPPWTEDPDQGCRSTSLRRRNLGKTVLKPGQSTTFTVKFAPTTPDSRRPKIQIQSNDENESPFIISRQGKCPWHSRDHRQPTG